MTQTKIVNTLKPRKDVPIFFPHFDNFLPIANLGRMPPPNEKEVKKNKKRKKPELPVPERSENRTKLFKLFKA